MNSTPSQPDLRHLILLGGGHAQVSVLKNLAMHPIAGLRVTLISRDVLTPYSGMLPGFIEGYYNADEITIDLSHLARYAGARFIHDEVIAIDPEEQSVTIKGRPPLHYDVLSVNIGSMPDLGVIPGAAEHATPIKPISTLLGRFDALINRSEGQRIAIIGGGAAGVEVALALEHRLKNHADTRIDIYHRGTRLVPEYPASAARHLGRICTARGIGISLGKAVSQVAPDHIVLADGTHRPADHTLVITAGGAPPWLREAGLDLDASGFIAVNEHLQSTSHEGVFASGDIAALGFAPRPKAGVFAVRGGVPLAKNIRRRLHGEPLIRWRPQGRYLALIGTGGGEAVPIRGGVSLPTSRLAWRFKEYLDRAFIDKFSILPSMTAGAEAGAANPPLATGLEDDDDPAMAGMRCLGCGAKAGYGTLHDALAEAARITKQTHPESTPFDEISSDSSTMTLDGTTIIQSVDAISALVDDPFLLGQIAARHAMSDIFASNATPHAALALMTLPPARAELQKDDISQAMAGAMRALHEDGVRLTGGHTSEGDTMQIGFAMTGLPNDAAPRPLDAAPASSPAAPAPTASSPASLNAALPRAGDVLILTKPLGVGVIMAAHSQGLAAASGHIRGAAIASMTESNGTAARILREYGRLAMTDITGFGLARHTLSLLGRGDDASLSVCLSHAALPLLPGVAGLIEAGVRSSLYPLNRRSAPLIMEVDAPDVILHDPQTGGGLLVAIAAEDAESALAALTRGGVKAVRIGAITADGGNHIRVVA